MAKHWQWLDRLWRGDAPLNEQAALSRRGIKLLGRARLSNLLAQSALRPVDDLPYDGSAAVGCELCREGVHWALLALREQTGSEASTETAAAEPEPRSAPSLEALWADADRRMLERAADSPERLEQVRADLLGKSFIDYAEFSLDRQTEVATRLHAFSERLIHPLVASQQRLDRAWLRKLAIVLTALGVVGGLAYAVSTVVASREQRLDLANGASWTASSQYPTCSCPSPQQVCDACPNYFFHTQPENRPSIVFDLGHTQALSKIVVENRRDCCAERALKLTVQVSTDNQHWRTVAKSESEFTTWRESFPTVQARWVKLFVPREDLLHLARVRLLP